MIEIWTLIVVDITYLFFKGCIKVLAILTNQITMPFVCVSERLCLLPFNV
jgi:hypothetical protein